MEKDRPPAEPSLEELKQVSHELKDKIDELRKKTHMPVNSSLGDPAVDAANADGRNDLKREDED